MFGVLLGVGWVLWGYVFIPVNEISVNVDNFPVDSDNIQQTIQLSYI